MQRYHFFLGGNEIFCLFSLSNENKCISLQRQTILEIRKSPRKERRLSAPRTSVGLFLHPYPSPEDGILSLYILYNNVWAMTNQRHNKQVHIDSSIRRLPSHFDLLLTWSDDQNSLTTGNGSRFTAYNVKLFWSNGKPINNRSGWSPPLWGGHAAEPSQGLAPA